MKSENAEKLATMLALSRGFAISISSKVSNKRFKQCLNCNKGHMHNNSFCSADCCKEWRAKK